MEEGKEVLLIVLIFYQNIDFFNETCHLMNEFFITDYQASSSQSAAKKIGKQHNTLPLWGNESTMNLNPLILANIQSSSYFKGMSAKVQ